MVTFPSALAGGRYLLVKPLGEGGMATVFRAFDQRLQVWRAIKILSADYSDKPRLRQRFESEAQTMALLEHKHIVRVYDVGNDADYAYIVMEILEGGALVDWLERHGPMPPRLALQVTIETCEGLAAAHAKGVVHRDIKPHNVLITRDGTCRVTDFGIAQVSTADQNITRTGAVMGTWGYMAPEQRTNAKGVDARADVYSSGAMLYTLLTNKMPMDLFAADRDDEMMIGVHEAIVPVLVKATEYKRENRYATILELAEALRGLYSVVPEVPTDTPPLARDPGPVPPPPARGEGSATAPGAPARPMTTSGTMVPGTAPDSDTMDGEGPQIKPTAQRSRGAGIALLAASGGVAALVMLGVALLVVAAGLYAFKGSNSGVAAANTPDPPPIVDRVPPKVPDAPKVAEDARPPDPPRKIVVDKPPRKVVKVDPPKVDPPVQTVVVVPAPTAEQCLKFTPPASAAVGTDLVIKASLCVEDGSEVTLWYRAVGGNWGSKLMPKALGSRMTKLSVDPSYAGGLEMYIEAGSVSKGSRSAPISVSVQ